MIKLPNHTQQGEVVLSPTRVNLGMRCLRKHSLADTLSYLPNEAEEAAALVFGERMHTAAALRWKEDAPEVGTEYLRSLQWPLNEKHSLGLALACYGAYCTQALLMPFASQDEEWLLEAVEKRVVLAVEPGLSLSFQLDRLVKEKHSGKLALADLKTASRCHSGWFQQWSRDLQMKLYAEAIVREYGRELSWLLVEGLAKDKPMLHLVVVPEVTQGMREEAWRAFRWVAKHDMQLLESCQDAATGIVDGEKLVQQILTQSPFSPAECFAYGHPCDYLRLCDSEPAERIALFREGYGYHEPDYV